MVMDPIAALLILIVIAAAAWERRTVHAALEREREQWRTERGELISRIQRPDFIPHPTMTPRAPSEPVERPEEVAAYRKVGVVSPLREADEADG